MKTTAADAARSWVRPEVRALSAYHVPDAAGLVKLDAMENPFPLPREYRAELAEMLAGLQVNRYPDPHARELKQALRHNMGLPDTAELVLGNGSDELILLLALLLAGPSRVVLAPQPSFVMYRMTAVTAGMQFVGVPLHARDFSLDMDAMLAAIARHSPALVYLACPNNPTGNLFAEAEIVAISEAAPGLVVIDEAYTAFAGRNSAALLDRYDNVLLMRTLSKTGLAGLRLGLLAGPSAWLAELEKLRLPYNVNVLTQASVAFALRHWPVFQAQTREIVSLRQELASQLSALEALDVYPSETNFLLVRTPRGRASQLFAALRERRVLVKNLHGSDPLLNDCLRVTVGTADENAAFMNALKASL